MEKLSQQAMSAFMADEADGVPLHVFGETDHRVSSSVWEQGNGAFSAPSLDFHLLEFQMSGNHRGVAEYDRECNDRAYDVVPGSLNYFQPDQNVTLDFEGEGRFHQIWIDRSLFRDVASSFLKGDPDNLRLLGFNGVFDPNIARAMAVILQESRSPTAGGQLVIDAAAQQIAVAILRRNIARPATVEPGRLLSKDELSRAISFIEDQIEENHGLDALSKSVGMNMYTFAHAFKESVGVSPHQFLIQRRINRAQELLAGTADPIADVAYACGFSSQAHMTNIFAKHVGISPARYRKSTRS